MSFYTDIARVFIGSRLGSQMQRRVLPVKLTMAVTYQCNHACMLCGIWKIYREHPEKRHEELSVDVYRSIFSELQNQLLYLDFTGGEPFLRQDMEEIFSSAASLCRKLNAVTVTTNGMAPDRIAAVLDSTAGRFPAIMFSAGVSLDGNPAFHDRMRGQKEAFNRAVATLNTLKELKSKQKNFDVKISYTLSAHSAGQFESFFREVVLPLGFRISDVTFNAEHKGLLYQQNESGSEVNDLDASQEAIKKDVNFILKSSIYEKQPVASRMKSFYRPHFVSRIPRYFQRPEKMLFNCRACSNSMYVDPYGNVFPCIIWGLRLGHVSDGLRNILDGAEASKAKKMIRQENCPVCWNACELIPSLLTSWKLPFLVGQAAVRGSFCSGCKS